MKYAIPVATTQSTSWLIVPRGRWYLSKQPARDHHDDANAFVAALPCRYCHSLARSATDKVENDDGSSIIVTARSPTYSSHYLGRCHDTMKSWNIQKVETMRAMFYGSASFNRPLSSWQAGSVTDFGHMFNRAAAFNQSLSTLDTSSAVDLSYMFYGASSFNQALSTWDIQNVETTTAMLYNAQAFNQALSIWQLSSATDLSLVF